MRTEVTDVGFLRWMLLVAGIINFTLAIINDSLLSMQVYEWQIQIHMINW